jgi:cell division protein FtsL
MKRSTFIFFFIACNIGMVLLQIQHHTNVVQQQYRKQRNDKLKEELLQKKAAALRSLYALKNPATIKQFATEELKMQTVSLQQIKTVSNR